MEDQIRAILFQQRCQERAGFAARFFDTGMPKGLRRLEDCFSNGKTHSESA
jgi:hypothetical protein